MQFKSSVLARVLLVLCLACTLLETRGQVIMGQIVDQSTGQPIAYVNIGVVGAGVGTVSDDQGMFRLRIDDLPDDAILRYSMLGYQSIDQELRQVRQAATSSDHTIRMTSIALELPQITVNPRDYKAIRAGNELTKPNLNAGFFYNDLGNELGTMVEIKARPAFVDQVNLHLAYCLYDTIFYRLNIYRTESGQPVERIYSSPLIIDYRGHQGEDVYVDLREAQVLVEDDFLVSLELIRELGEGGLMFCAGFFKDKTWYRKTSQASWETSNVGIGISVDIRQEKK